MDYNHYLQANYKYLYQELAKELMNHLEQGKDLIQTLSESIKYREDYEFRTIIESARVLYLMMTEKHSESLSLSEKLVEQALALELWNLVSVNLNLQGNVYVNMGLIERSLERYHRAIRNEKAHGLKDMTSLLYHNLAVLFANVMDYEKAYEYQLLAFETLERGAKNSPLFVQNSMIYLVNIVVYMCFTERIDEIPPMLDRMDRLDFSKIPSTSIFAYCIGHMYYAFYSGNLEKGKEYYKKALQQLSDEEIPNPTFLLHTYLTIHDLLHLDLSLCEEEFQQVEYMQKDKNVKISVELLTLLRKYYKFVGEQERYEGMTERYIQHLEDHQEMILDRQRTSLRIVEDMLENQENFEEVSAENTELKMIAEEAVRHKNAVQGAYQRIEMINELGKKLMSSLELSSIVESVYVNLKENVPLSSFILVIAEPEYHRLRAVANFHNDREGKEFTVDMGEADSLFATCYRENRLLCFTDLETEWPQKGRNLLPVGEKESIGSALFMPMEVNGRVIGACSIQSGGRNLYQETQIEFLKALLPYLSIALNNAMYSLRLEKEVKIRIEAQKNLEETNRELEETNRKLEEANRKLEQLSLMDGLTQIGNRRDFEHRRQFCAHAAFCRHL